MRSKAITILLVLLASLQVLSVYAGNTVELTVEVVEPEVLLYKGRGYLYIQDQKGAGRAALHVPSTEGTPVRLEIMKRRNVKAFWEWNVKSHTSETWSRRHYDYTMDVYHCEDDEGRILVVYTHTYTWRRHISSTSIGIGKGVFFTGRLLSHS